MTMRLVYLSPSATFTARITGEPESKYLPVPRIAHIDVAIMVEAALLGYNPVAMATLLGQYILDLDRETAMEAERRRLPVPLRHELACAYRVMTAISGLDMGHKWAELMVIMSCAHDGPIPEGLFT